MQSHPTPGACTCSATTDLPPGARHAGQVLNEAGQPTHQLVLLPQRPDKRLNWDDAKAWAASVGGDLPSPQEQALLFINCCDALPKTWCWSNKEHEKDASFAVDCHFNNGSTKFAVKGYLNSAVAVIRTALDSFSPSGDTSAHVCTQASKPSADTSKAITALRKRLQRWELDHLRTLAAEQADRLEQAQARIEALETEVSRAWDTAESWRMDAMELVNELQESGQNVGLTQSGALVVMHQDVAAATHPKTQTTLEQDIEKMLAELQPGEGITTQEILNRLGIGQQYASLPGPAKSALYSAGYILTREAHGARRRVWAPRTQTTAVQGGAA